MQVSSRWRIVALVGVALFAGSIVGPPLAKAATAGLVRIEGAGSTHKAKVNGKGQLSVNTGASFTGAHQMTTAEAPGRATVVVFGIPKCTAGGIYTVPAGKALIITGVNFYHSSTAVPPHSLVLTFGASATPCQHLATIGVATEPYLSQNQVFQPGIPVPAGDALGLAAGNDIGAAEVYGYLVPKTDVAASTGSALPRPSSVTFGH